MDAHPMSKAGSHVVVAVVACAVLLSGCVVGETVAPQGSDAPRDASLIRGRPAEGEKLPAHITGTIIDTELIPIVEAEIVVTPGDIVVLTDAAGTFAVGPLEPGEYVVIAQKRGYASKEQQVMVTESDEAVVRITLEATASDVPHHETLSQAMYLICHVVSPQTPLGRVNAPCAGLLDLAVGGTNTLDTWIFFFVIDKPGFQSLAMEMVWNTQQLGHDGLMQLSTEGRAAADGASVGVAGTVYGGTQGPPFHMIIHAGNNYWAPDPEAIFYPEPNATEEFKMLIAGGGDNTTVPGAAFFIEFRPTAYLTFFYNRQASPEFSILPPE